MNIWACESELKWFKFSSLHFDISVIDMLFSTQQIIKEDSHFDLINARLEGLYISIN